MDLYNRLSRSKNYWLYSSSSAEEEPPTLGSPFVQHNFVDSSDIASPVLHSLFESDAYHPEDHIGALKRHDELSRNNSLAYAASNISSSSPQSPTARRGKTDYVDERPNHALRYRDVSSFYDPGSPESIRWTGDDTVQNTEFHTGYTEHNAHRYRYDFSDGGTLVDMDEPPMLWDDDGDDVSTVRHTPLSVKDSKGKAPETPEVLRLATESSEDSPTDTCFDWNDQEIAWDHYSATIEQSREEWRDVCMSNSSPGESSKSFTAFLVMHDGYYDRTYEDYYFQEWLKWHRHIEKEHARPLRYLRRR